ncbi:BrxA family protein [Actinomyces sp.]|uniref:BrxA family protein n=1 Tax=Actinomyces sp. TaxID=29317 RepID=UPI0034C5BAAD
MWVMPVLLNSRPAPVPPSPAPPKPMEVTSRDRWQRRACRLCPDRLGLLRCSAAVNPAIGRCEASGGSVSSDLGAVVTTSEPYRLSFVVGGLLATEATIAAPLYLELRDWEAVRQALNAGNLLHARTRSTAVRLTRELIQRLSVLTDAEIAYLDTASCPPPGSSAGACAARTALTSSTRPRSTAPCRWPSTPPWSSCSSTPTRPRSSARSGAGMSTRSPSSRSAR